MDQNLSESVQVLFQKAHVESLLNNRQQDEKWKTYQKDLTDAKDHLNLLLKDLSVRVLVPIGNKALFRGKLVHTNDVMIFLGDGYFTKGSVAQALEVIERRLARCQETIDKLSKERELLESRVMLRNDQDIFPGEESKEIIEEYVEDQEEKWKEEHRSKVREYRQCLIEMKKEQPSDIKTDEDLWKRLEMLEMEEELDDELHRLGSDSETSSDSNDSNSSNDSTDQDISLQTDDKPLIHLPDLNRQPGRSIMKRSSSVDNPSPLNNNDTSDDHIVINFNHSSHKPDIKQIDDIINSPYDIYTKFSAELDVKSRKLSRRVSFADCPEIKTFENKSDNVYMDSNFPEQSLPTAFGDVVEHTEPVNLKSSESRPLSKFKSARIRQQPL